MIVTIHHGEMPREDNEAPTDMVEHIECDSLKIVRSKKFIRLLFFQGGELKDNREFREKLRAYVTEKGKTIDRIQFGLIK